MALQYLSLGYSVVTLESGVHESMQMARNNPLPRCPDCFVSEVFVPDWLRHCGSVSYSHPLCRYEVLASSSLASVFTLSSMLVTDRKPSPLDSASVHEAFLSASRKLFSPSLD